MSDAEGRGGGVASDRTLVIERKSANNSRVLKELECLVQLYTGGSGTNTERGLSDSLGDLSFISWACVGEIISRFKDAQVVRVGK